METTAQKTAAASLKGRNIGIIVSDLRISYLSNLVQGATLKAAELGFSVRLALHEKNKEKELKLINKFLCTGVDALLLCPANKGSAFEDFLKKVPIPVVAAGNYATSEVPFVGTNEKKAAADAVSLLVEKGYSKVIFICPQLSLREQENIFTHEQRAYGFIEAAHKKNIEAVFVTCNLLDELDSILQSNMSKTAVLVSGDCYALRIIRHLQKRGLRVPEDIGVMGFGTTRAADFVEPRLTTISRDVEAVGKLAAEILVGRLNGREPEKAETLLNCPVVNGGSV